MAPGGFALIVLSPGISPLGLVASTAFSVTSKSNHLLSLGGAVDAGPRRKRRKTRQTLGRVMESRTIYGPGLDDPTAPSHLLPMTNNVGEKTI